MSRLQTLLTCGALGAILSAPVPAVAQSGGAVETGGRSAAPAYRAHSGYGSINGTIVDEAGRPIGGVTVSAFGTAMVFAVTDTIGQFSLTSLPPGPYLVRAHREGFAASGRQVVDVTASSPSKFSLTLHRLGPGPESVGTSGTAPAVLAAGFGATQAPDAPDETGEDGESVGPHEHTEMAWRMRHAPRGVLKDSVDYVDAGESAVNEGLGEPVSGDRFGGSQDRWAASLFNDLPFSGEVNLLTTSSFDRPQELFSTNQLPRGIAFISIGAPAGRHGDWSIQGAMTEGDVSSWVLAGSYANRGLDVAHRYQVGMSYSMQRYAGGNAAALAAVTDGNRNVGAVFGFDDWTITERVVLSYGARYARHDYLEGSGLWSPRAAVTISAAPHTRIRALASQRLLAPGAEEFLPPTMPGMWLPPERTFAPIDGGGAFRAERSRHLEFAIEHDLDDRYVVAVRRFYQTVDDQLVTLFGVRVMDGARSDLGHYFVGNAGHVAVQGWGVTFSHAPSHRVRGSVDYSVSRADWTTSPESALLAEWAPSLVRPTVERVHDFTTAVDTEFPETATRVHVVYKINSGFTNPVVTSHTPTFDARFDVQVHQALPFMQFTSTDWAFLLAVRNLFRDPEGGSAAYDELLVVRPPKRIVGGLMVRF
jgi:hypothetical protein